MHPSARSCTIAAFALLALASSHPLGAADATTAPTTAATATAAVDPVAASPWASAHGHDQYGDWADLTELGVVQRFRFIPAGTFTMGGGDLWFTPHAVTLTKPYWMADSSCTQALWQVVMGSNPSKFTGDPQRPVEQVSWDDCQQLLAALNQRDGRLSARLPTEAEWEYACRAGTTGQLPGLSLDALAWYRDNSGGTTHPVKLKEPNSWGLYDMIGNVFQWCGDWFGDFPADPVTDPVGAASGSLRVVRGGSWFMMPALCRSTFHAGKEPGSRTSLIGFRICLPVHMGPNP